SEYELLSSDLSVSHIALSSGFSNSSYYSKHFRFWFGMTPQEYREKYAGQTLQNSEPLMVYCELADYSDMIQENLRELAAAFSDAHAEPLSQTIHVDNADFDDSFRLRRKIRISKDQVEAQT
ncbi:helix-turn-helix domain-containing protein, partial [Eubacteriales bacterium DFI.9.88]|nr:helix-turn-helix domain-containing protein [Eubacteriales bacterium DFI.9.88]